MSEATGISAPIRAHDVHHNSGGSHNTQNRSPTKQTFNTIKNFLKSKSSLTDVKVWSDAKRDDNGYKDRDNSYSNTSERSHVHESASTTRLSDFKLKVPRKKRSLGSLLPPSTNNDTNDTKTGYSNHNNASAENIHDSRSFIIPLPTSQKFSSASSSPQFNIFRSTAGVRPSGKNDSPTKAMFSLGGNGSYTTIGERESHVTPATPNMSEHYSFSKEWVPPNTTIRGTYVHDWTNNTSPRSLAESMKVGKVETPSVNMNIQMFQSPSRNNTNNTTTTTNTNKSTESNNSSTANKDISISSVSRASTIDKVIMSSETSLSNNNSRLISQTTSNQSYNDMNATELRSKLKLDLKEITEPSHPLPSPCTFENNVDPLLKLVAPISMGLNTTPNVDAKLEKFEEDRAKSNTLTDADTDSISSHHSQGSQGSQFSFLPNRTASMRFYKSNEQIALEKAMHDDKIDRIKFSEFIGTSQDIENDLLDVCSNAKVTNGLDDDVNYIDYEAEDDTDALFNRDLFGFEESRPPAGLGLEFNDDYSTPRSRGLELTDDDDEEQPRVRGLELTDNEEEQPVVRGLELTDDADEQARTTGLELHDDDYDDDYDDQYEDDDYYDISEPRAKGLELDDYEGGEDYAYDEPRAKGLELSDSEEDIQPKRSSIKEKENKEETVLNNDNITKSKQKEMVEASSRAILEMLNRNNSSSLVIKKQRNHEIQIQHRPSATLQRHRSIKFHQLSCNLEDREDSFGSNYENLNVDHSDDKPGYNNNDFQDSIWEDSGALDEVNQIPEDYDYDDYGSSFDDYYNNDGDDQVTSPTSNQFDAPSKATTPTSEKFALNRSSSYGRGSKSTPAAQHLWKNLVRKTSDGSTHSGRGYKQQVERIQLDNRTITLFDNPDTYDTQYYEEESEDEDDGSLSPVYDESNEDAGLSTIME